VWSNPSAWGQYGIGKGILITICGFLKRFTGRLPKGCRLGFKVCQNGISHFKSVCGNVQPNAVRGDGQTKKRRRIVVGYQITVLKTFCKVEIYSQQLVHK
jgi:hypothetical protein